VNSQQDLGVFGLSEQELREALEEELVRYTGGGRSADDPCDRA